MLYRLAGDIDFRNGFHLQFEGQLDIEGSIIIGDIQPAVGKWTPPGVTGSLTETETGLELELRRETGAFLRLAKESEEIEGQYRGHFFPSGDFVAFETKGGLVYKTDKGMGYAGIATFTLIPR